MVTMIICSLIAAILLIIWLMITQSCDQSQLRHYKRRVKAIGKQRDAIDTRYTAKRHEVTVLHEAIEYEYKRAAEWEAKYDLMHIDRNTFRKKYLTIRNRMSRVVSDN